MTTEVNSNCKPDINTVKIIQRQTNYTEVQIYDKLLEHDNDIEKVILEYNNVRFEVPEKKLTTNQKIFSAIRENMNQIALNHEMRLKTSQK